MERVDLESAAKTHFGLRVVAVLGKGSGLLEQQVGFGGQELGDEFADVALWLGPHEARDDLPVSEAHDCGNAPHGEALGGARGLVDVELRKRECAGMLVRDALEDGAERPTRRAPRRPEIDGNRSNPRCFDSEEGACEQEPVCPARGGWRRVSQQMREFLERIPLSELMVTEQAPLIQVGAPATVEGTTGS